MAVLKQIKFGESATPIAKTVVTAASESVLTVGNAGGKTNGVDEDADYGYEIDLTLSNDGTLTKDNGALKVGTVPAEQVRVADSDEKFTATNVEAALSELKDDIATVGGNAKSYTIIEKTESLPTNVLHRYKLQQTVGSTVTEVGENIDILKDNSLVAAKLSTTDATWNGSAIVDGSGADALVLVYKDADGAAQVIAIDVSAFLKEAEFGDGLQVTNGVVSAKLGNGLEFAGESGENKLINVKIDSTSESFLTVGAGGVKLAGVQNAINTAIDALDKTDDAAVAGQYVAAVEENNGIVAVKARANVSEAVLNNYAKGSAPAAGSEAVAATDTVNQAISKLEHQVDAAKSATTSAIQALDHTDAAVDGQVVTAVSTADGIATPTKADLAGVKLGGFTQDANATGAIADTDTLGAALNKLENGIDAAKQAAEAGHSAVAKDANASHLTLSEATDTTTGKKTYTIGEDNIASDTDLDAEVTRAQNAEGEIADKVGLTGAEGSRVWSPTTNYGGSSATVKANMQALDTQLKTVSDNLAAVKYKVTGTTLEFFGISEKTA